jgi:hypothetical protein
VLGSPTRMPVRSHPRRSLYYRAAMMMRYSPLPRSLEERVYELSPRLDASAFAQSYSPEFVSWSGDEETARRSAAR